ncbi:MAG: hypothetical protein GWO26_04905 [Phycisphaerae bacterium]|nr:hypothetical protein [Phycisphaerae bacterium]
MARKKRTKKTRTKRISFKGRTSKRKSRTKKNYHPSLMRVMKVFVVACVSAAMGIGFIFVLREGFISLDSYVKKSVPNWQKASPLKLIDVPLWVNEPLQTKIYAAAAPNGNLKPNEETARLVRNNLVRKVPWLDQVRVQTTHDSIQISGKWRRPLVLARSSMNKFYVDSDMVVLDYVPLPNLHIVRIEGLPLIIKTPLLGRVWQRDDIASIDISNFKGRENTRFPHIVLYTKDNTEIIWGAELREWPKYLESTDEQKLAKLYEYYKKHGSLLGGVTGVKYINLCDPQDNIPLPVDKY